MSDEMDHHPNVKSQEIPMFSMTVGPEAGGALGHRGATAGDDRRGRIRG